MEDFTFQRIKHAVSSKIRERSQRPNLTELASRGALSVSEALASFGRALFADGAARHNYLHAILAVKDRFRHFLYQLQSAWDVNARWEMLTPSLNNIPCPLILWRAFVSLAFLWGWTDFAIVLLLNKLQNFRKLIQINNA